MCFLLERKDSQLIGLSLSCASTERRHSEIRLLRVLRLAKVARHSEAAADETRAGGRRGGTRLRTVHTIRKPSAGPRRAEAMFFVSDGVFFS